MTGPNGTPSEDPEKRLAILEHAIATFAELGFRGTDVQLIADRAGVGKGTVYRYFGNKRDLFWATTSEVLQRLNRSMIAAMEGRRSPLDKLRAACLAYATFFEVNPPYLEVFVQDRAEFRGEAPDSHRQQHEEMIEHFAGILQEAIDNGEVGPVDVRETIIALGGVLYGTVVFACYPHDDRTLTERARHAVDVFLTGIRAPIPQPSEGISP